MAIGDRTRWDGSAGVATAVGCDAVEPEDCGFSRVLLAIILGIAALMFAIGLSQGRG